MKRYEGVIVLGAQIGIKKGKMMPAFHTEMRARAAGVVYQQNIAPKFILSGGYNFGVRYDLDLSVPVFGTPTSDRKPDFSDETRIKAKWYRSEASVIAELLRTEYGVPPEVLILEEDSKTTKENAQYCKAIAERCGWKKIGLLTSLYHMERALKDFQEVGLKVEPLFAEDLLPLEEKSWIARICEYYSVPRGGKQWDVEKIREILTTAGKTIGELIGIIKVNACYGKLVYKRSPNLEGCEAVGILEEGTLPSCVDVLKAFNAAYNAGKRIEVFCAKGCHRVLATDVNFQPSGMMLEVYKIQDR